VIDSAQPAAPEVLGELVGIARVALVPLAGLPSPIAHDHPIDARGQQVVQPLRLGPLLDRDVDRPRIGSRPCA
jgi:hypothetical protein